MNKQKLLLLTFMQNNRGEKIGHGSDSIIGGGAATRSTGTLPSVAQVPSGYMCPSLGLSPSCSRNLARMSSSLEMGLEYYCAWGKGP